MFSGSVVKDWVPVVEAAMEKHGRNPADIPMLAEGELFLADSHEAAVRGYQRSRMGQYRTRKADLEEIVAINWIGTSDEVVEKIGQIKEHGVEHVNILHIAGDTLDERCAQMQRFSEEVMSKFP